LPAAGIAEGALSIDPLTRTFFLFLIAAFALGALVILLATLPHRARALRTTLWPLYGSEFLIVGFVLVPAALGGVVFVAALLLLLWRGQWEMFRVFDFPGAGAVQVAAYAMGAGVLLLAILGRFSVLAVILVLAAVVLLISIAIRQQRASVALATLFFPAALLAMIAALRLGENGLSLLVVSYAIVEMSDAFALLAGKFFGRRKLMPSLSPGKTAEGVIAGTAAGLLTGLILAPQLLGMMLTEALFLSLIVLLAGISGDLFTSVLKRARGAKDFAPVLPRHGGALDIYDSFLVAAPAVFLLRPHLL
jgi:phosphatidate cytidylyltransferase